MNELLFGDVQPQIGSVNPGQALGLARTALLVGASATVGWLVSVIPGVDFGQYGGVIVPLILFALDFARRWLGSQLPPVESPQG